MVFARGLFFKRKTSKRARQKNARAFSAACGSQRIIMGKIKSGFEGILEGKKETLGVLGFRDSIQKKKTTKTTKTLKDNKDNTNAVFFRRHVVRVGARKRRRRRRRRQVEGAFNNAFNARRSFSVAQQRLFRFGELERRRRRRRRRVELHDAPIFCRGEILGKLGAERR